MLTYFEETLKELQTFVGTLSPSDHRLTEAWYSSISAEPIVETVLPSDWFARALSVQLLDSRTASLHCYHAEGEGRISLHHFGLRLTFSESARTVLVALVEGQSIALNGAASAIDLSILKLLADKRLIGPASS